ncbi:MAG: CDP-alcohol phosphatidyltransferase family protein [Sedimentisphaerales bacterium]|nr:CDP-alcohol phosphatidyltransferase family protein [Sedimentisphaerales bacterium]
MIRFVPNLLTFSRLVMTVIFLVMILYSPGIENKAQFLDVAFVLFVVAGLTDIIDGKIARKYNVTSKFGRMIDPLADKVLVCGTFICFAVIGQPTLYDLSPAALRVIHWAVVAILLAREVYVTVLRHLAEAKGINFAATVSGKIKMFLQSFAIGTVIIKMGHVPNATWASCFTSTVFLAMLTVTVISGFRATKRRLSQKATEEQG